MGLQPIYGKGPHSLFRAGSEAALGNIRVSDIPKPPKYCVIFIAYILAHIVCGRRTPNTTWRVASWGLML